MITDMNSTAAGQPGRVLKQPPARRRGDGGASGRLVALMALGLATGGLAQAPAAAVNNRRQPPERVELQPIIIPVRAQTAGAEAAGKEPDAPMRALLAEAQQDVQKGQVALAIPKLERVVEEAMQFRSSQEIEEHVIEGILVNYPEVFLMATQ